MMKRGMFLLLLIGLLVGCAAPAQEIVTVSGDYYEMDFHLPPWWENKLNGWNRWFIPPQGHRCLIVDIFMKSVTEKPYRTQSKRL